MKTSEFPHQKLIPRPHLGDVERVEAELVGIGLLRLHNLHMGGSFKVLTALNGAPRITLGVIRVLTAHVDGLSVGELLLVVLCDEVIFDVDDLALLVYPLESVTSVTVVEASALRRAVVAEEHEASVVAFECVGKEVKQSIGIQQEILGVARL